MIGSVNVPGVSKHELEQGLGTKEDLLKTAAAKETLAEQDSLPLVDSADGSTTKRVFWSKFKGALKAYFDDLYADANHAAQHASTGRDPITPADIGAATKEEVNAAINSAIGVVLASSY